jgi:hypothetical protein
MQIKMNQAITAPQGKRNDMKRLRMTPAIRISLGLAIFTMTLLMGAEMVGIIPERIGISFL